MGTIRTVTVFSLLAGALLVAGCETTPSYQTEVAERMGGPLRDLGLVPIIPPSEDVRVGDVYLSPNDPETSSAGGRIPPGAIAQTRWAHLPLLDKLQAEYGQRPTWPKTPDAHRQIRDDVETLTVEEPIHPDGSPLFTPGQPVIRLRQVMLDTLLTTTLHNEYANLVIPTEAIGVVFGSGWSDDKVAVVRTGTAEAYSTSTATVVEALLEMNPDEDGESVHYVRQPWRDMLQLIPDPDDGTVVLSVVTEVFFVRTADIAIEAADGARGPSEGTAVSPEELGIPDHAKSTEDSEDADEGSVPAEDPDPLEELDPDQDLDPTFSAFVRAQAINDLLMSRDADDTPGGFIRFISVTPDSATVRHFWVRGIAIAVRGVSIEVEQATGKVVVAGRMGTPLPELPKEPSSGFKVVD